MNHIKPPTSLQEINPEQISIFLAGSIEQGRAEPWQDQIVESLTSHQVTILNPRRDEWDDSWEQSIHNSQFKEQVNWELEAQENASLIAMYFSPNTRSPITLLELGLFAHSKKSSSAVQLVFGERVTWILFANGMESHKHIV